MAAKQKKDMPRHELIVDRQQRSERQRANVLNAHRKFKTLWFAKGGIARMGQNPGGG